MLLRIPCVVIALGPLGLLASQAQAQLGAPPVPPENPITEAKRILGKALFWDEQLSTDNTIACGTCHIPASGGSDPRPGFFANHPGPDGQYGTVDDLFGSPGVAEQDAALDYQPDALFGFEPQVTERFSPSMIGAAHFDEQFWEGRADGTFVDPETGQVSVVAGGSLEHQALIPILSPVEMGHEGRSWSQVRVKLAKARPMALSPGLTPDLAAALQPGIGYRELFSAAFGDANITAERIAFALATYQRTLNPDDTPWDRFMAGQSGALSSNQILGMNLFNGSGARCSECHPAPLFSDGSYRNLGIRPIAEDPGRMAITGDFADRGKFKVPSLRNSGLRRRLFHDGSAGNLITVMIFYDGEGGPHFENKDPLLSGLNLPTQDRLKVEDFLFGGLTDARVEFELPPFDRPMLHGEQPNPGPVLLGGAVAGSGGQAPKMIALAPANVGHPGFKLGVHQALGGAPARLAWSTAPAPPAGTVGNRTVVFPAQPILLEGSGPGQGYGTWHRPLPDSPELVGLVLFAQWYVNDPGAAGGVARSELARVELF